MTNCYTVKIYYRAKAGSEREKFVLECAKEYGCDPDTHLFDKLLEDRFLLIEAHKVELARIACEEAKLAEDKRRVMGGKK
jgi:hypothetical protein